MMQTQIRQRQTGLSRRNIVRLGSLTAFGFGLGDWFSLAAQGAIARTAQAKSCILLWLDGGPSHLETFDLKPEAPREVRGPFSAIETNVSGIRICEHLRQTALIADKLAIVRSVTSPLGEHGLANHYLMTGYPPSPVLEYPSYGAVVAHLEKQPTDLPSYIAIPNVRPGDAGYLGQACEPFITGGDPSKADFRVRDLELFPDVDENRLMRRREYLRHFDAHQRSIESRTSSGELTKGTSAADLSSSARPTKTSETSLDQAYRLLTSAHAKTAFDLSQESESTRARYGPRMFGQSCLLARRLVERGVPFVTVTNSGWDTHENLVLQLRDGYSGAKQGVGLLPTFDQAFSALITDLADRGMLDETLVVVMGEFGRTPKLNTRGGRDHWPRVFSVVMAGGGIRGGQVIGGSDAVGETPRDLPVTPSDLACSIFTLLGIDPSQLLITPDGRPVQINRGGRFISGLA
jgi:hypothetical protein